MMDVYTTKRFNRVLEHAMSYAPDAYFFTGDFSAREPQEWVYESLRPRLDALGVPTVILPGNHDDRTMMRKYFDLPGQGDEPVLRLVSLKSQVFLCLDTRYGKLEEAQLSWLTDRLKAHPGAHIVMHHPPIKMGLPFMDNNYALDDTGALREVLHRQAGVVHVFCGHYHSGRTVYEGNLAVHLCPPSSFFIAPDAVEFEQDFLPPAYQRLEWSDDGHLRIMPIYLG